MKFAWVLAVVLPATGYAEVLTVRGGEHENFTRLVLPVQRSSDWKLNQLGDSYELSVQGASFDTSQTFLRIGNERVLSVSENDEKLLISLSCKCRITPLVVDGYLALDVAESSLSSLLPVLVPAAPNVNVFGSQSFRANSMEALLSRRIAKAAGEGLLDITTGPLEDVDVETFGYNGLIVRSDLENTRDPVDQKRSECPPLGWLDYSAWEIGGDFSTDTQKLRGVITDELDDVSEQALISLIRLYFYYGLFDEARSVLRVSGNEAPEANILERAMSRSLSGVGRCGDHTAIWSYLSGDDVDIAAVQRAFMQAPETIRNEIGADLIRQLLFDQKLDVALSMFAYLGDGSADYYLTQARILAAEQNWEKAIEAYVVALERRPSSNDIAVELIDVAAKGALVLDRDIIDLVAIAVGRPPQLEHSVATALALTSARSGHFDLAADLVMDLREPDLSRQILDLASKSASDIEIIRLAFGVFPNDLVLSSTVFMERLRSLGFHNAVPQQTDMSDGASSEILPGVLSLQVAREQLKRSSETRRQVEAAFQGNGL